VGVEDNFFELGGTSLLATQMISWLQGEFSVPITVASLFHGPSVRALSELISEQAAGKGPPKNEMNRGRIRKILAREVFQNRSKFGKNREKI
jgi:hypothetical protein